MAVVIVLNQAKVGIAALSKWVTAFEKMLSAQIGYLQF
jgi:hypothetical protein